MAQEKTIENKIKEYLTEIGAWYIKYHGTKMTRSGVPDLLVCYKGRFVGIEVKAPNEQPTELQKYHIRKIREAGGIAFVADNLQIVKDNLEVL